MMIYDGDCHFCRHWIERWKEDAGEHIAFVPWQQVASRFPDIPQNAFENAVQWVGADGRVMSGADAVFRMIEASPYAPRWMRWLWHFPGVKTIVRWSYRVIAKHRGIFSFLTKLLWGSNPKRPTYRLAHWLLLRMIALVYFIAFLSLAFQLRGLIGARGVLPAGEFLELVKSRFGDDAYWLAPTLCWLNSSDGFMLGLCIAGAAISLAVMLGAWPTAGFVALWALYLSLTVASQVFLSFQWDVLLLETGLLAIFLQKYPRLGRLLILWLLFRLTFESGVVKLTSGDPTWHDLTALSYHYETQPLPLVTAWYAHQSPLWFKQFSCAMMFACELIAPFAVFGPKLVRRAGAAAMIGLQLLIAGTGNYTFFNLLTIALCLPLLDDDVWPAAWTKNKAQLHDAPRWIFAPFAATYVAITGMQLAVMLDMVHSPPKLLLDLQRKASPFRSMNSYGLFAVMTTSRPEIVIEGSDDDITWQDYEFRWKPGDLHQAPRLAAPHQPRLDWQMWFAALGNYQENPWFMHLLGRLLEGSPYVLDLFARNPFPDKPPRYVRAVVYDYHFTNSTEKRADEVWWKRERKGLYCPVVTLNSDGELRGHYE